MPDPPNVVRAHAEWLEHALEQIVQPRIGAHDVLASLDSTIFVERHLRVVDDGIVTSAGVAAGIDMALSLVALLRGKAVAHETAKYMECPRHTPKEARL